MLRELKLCINKEDFHLKLNAFFKKKFFWTLLDFKEVVD